ncbi:MAG: hypothetical protein PHW41_04820 [Eubacteriales bacterium]|nr:hypothetical protein [Eubacteriales bacterium]
MSQKKAYALIRDRLYLVDDLFVRSETEAKARAAQCTISARALVMQAEAKSSLPEESWAGFYRALDAADQRALGGWRNQIKDMTRALRKHSRVVITSLILALILAFFTLVPTGRAFANEIFDYFAQVIGLQLKISKTDHQQTSEQEIYQTPEELPDEAKAALDSGEELKIVSDPVYYDSVADFEEVSGLDAFTLNSDQLTCTSVMETDHMFAGKMLRTIYQMPDGKNIYIMEQWLTGDGQSTSTGGALKEKQVLNGKTMYYTDDAENGMLDGIVLLDNSVLQITADAGVDEDFIWQLFQ